MCSHKANKKQLSEQIITQQGGCGELKYGMSAAPVGDLLSSSTLRGKEEEGKKVRIEKKKKTGTLRQLVCVPVSSM